MNKNQEALNRVNKAITIALACQGIDLKEDNETVLALKTLQELVDKYEKMEEENKKLKDKETPKKPIERLFEQKKHFKICPNCWEKDIKTFVYGKYCDECGQRLE